jgi:hypothetical protein
MDLKGMMLSALNVLPMLPRKLLDKVLLAKAFMVRLWERLLRLLPKPFVAVLRRWLFLQASFRRRNFVTPSRLPVRLSLPVG